MQNLNFVGGRKLIAICTHSEHERCFILVHFQLYHKIAKERFGINVQTLQIRIARRYKKNLFLSYCVTRYVMLLRLNVFDVGESCIPFSLHICIYLRNLSPKIYLKRSKKRNISSKYLI